MLAAMEFTFLFPEEAASHFACCLMQGLHQLGHTINANVNPGEKGDSHGLAPPFSRMSASFINRTSSLSGGKLVVDVSAGIGRSPEKVLEVAKTSRVALINMSDSANWADYSDDFIVFSAHSNTNATRRGTTVPIGFGLSQDIIDFSNDFVGVEKTRGALKNYRPSESQSIRNVLDLIFVPKLRQLMPVEERFSPPDQYARDLASYQAVLSYCGDLYTDLRLNPFFKERDTHNRLAFLALPPHPVVLRFDSWRFYEAALFGACPITLDFDIYGLTLPSIPKPYVEYLPVDLANIDTFIGGLKKSLADDPNYIVEIGKRARRWVIEHYSPRALAEHFLDALRERNALPDKALAYS
jgi:hypothetical protein